MRLWQRRWVFGILATAETILWRHARAQAAPNETVAAALTSLRQRAAVVFVGQVTAIRQVPAGGELRGNLVLSGGRLASPSARPVSPRLLGSGVVQVEFRVDTPLLGTVPATYVLREWSGLWSGGTARYWVGERAMVFLRASSASGMATPVDDMEGLLPVARFTADGEPEFDLTRLRSSLQRRPGAPMPDASHAALSLEQLQQLMGLPPAGAASAAPPFTVDPPSAPISERAPVRATPIRELPRAR